MKIKLLGLFSFLLLLFILIDLQYENYLARWLGQNNSSGGVLRVGINLWPGYEPLYLSRDLGYYQQPVQLIDYLSATQVSRALRNGAIQVATLTLDELAILRQYDLPIKVILVMDISHGGDVILSRPAFPDLASLKGHRIGVESTALGAYVLSRALQLQGMSPQDVTIVPLEIQEHERAFSHGEIDAVVTFEPIRSQLLAIGAHQIFDSTQIPGEIVDILVAREDALQTHPAAVQEIVASWFRALAYRRANPEDALKRLAARMQSSPAETQSMLKGLRFPDLAENLRLLSGQPCPLQRTFSGLTATMKAIKLLEREANANGLCAPEFLNGLSQP